MKRSNIDVAIESFCNNCLGYCINSIECPSGSCALWEVRTVDLSSGISIEILHDSIDNYCVTCASPECGQCRLNLEI